MAFEDLEESKDSSRPIELFEIHYSGNHWYYTSADRDIDFQGVTYTAVPCSAGEMEQSMLGNKSDLSAQFHHNVEFAEIFRIQPPSEVVSMTVLTKNYLVPNDYVVRWKGRILNCRWKFPWVELVTETIATSAKRAGLRRLYSISCPHVLYGKRCGVLRDNHKEDSIVFSISGFEVVVQSLAGRPDNYFAGGMLTWYNNASGNVERRMISLSDGTTGTLTLSAASIGLQGGQAVSVFPGCDHSISTCDSKFNNKDRHGGMPYIPNKNPFNGTTLF